MKARDCLLLMLTCVAFAANAAGTLLQGIDQTAVWNHPDDLFAPSELTLEFKTAIKPDSLIVKTASPNGMDYLVLYEKLEVAGRLPVDFSGSDCIEGDEIAASCFLQAGQHDFDADGLPEIVLVLGDGLINLQVNIVAYHPPARPADAMRSENWELIGNFSGQTKAIIDGQSILLPFGSQGLEEKKTLIDGKFINAS
ncbi:hypothetical protein [Thiorhodovibrio frisius]|uniref:FG-GAP repeat protein n=1 Tax=Thiorhodovibrio frisius TaxID=631362 RepID=H8YXJ0_9GAMM|nr:hypothetical protein [Thiorhodovibrio frisius]EIC23166.1 hypothetical protein Thi970DRAFT_00819 [Thiorhodovibrio frisius]WPL22563.1 hypothetical protein Thiofri_02730 [Thiorhodovibrio frisius]